MLRRSNYADYIIERLFDSDRDEQANRSDTTSQFDNSIVHHRQASQSKLPAKQPFHQQAVLEEEEDGSKYQEADPIDQSPSRDSAAAEDAEDAEDDNQVNEAIIHSFPKKFFSKVLAVFSQQFGIYRSVVLSKLANGVIINKKTRGQPGICAKGSGFDPLAYSDDLQNKRKRSSLETHGFQKRLVRFDFDNGKLLFYLNKTRGKSPAKRGAGLEEKVLAVSNKWVLEEEFELDGLNDVLLPETTSKMLKARMREFYQPSQFGVYNQAELCGLERCSVFPFAVDLAGKARLECVADDLGIFLDLYCGVNYLLH